MILKNIFYLLPYSFQKLISKLSYQLYNNIENDFIYNPKIGYKYNLSIKDKKKLQLNIKTSSKVVLTIFVIVNIYVIRLCVCVCSSFCTIIIVPFFFIVV